MGRINQASRSAALRALVLFVGCGAGLTAAAADPGNGPLTVRKPHRRPPVPVVPMPVVPSPLLPGAPIPWSGSPVLTPQTLSVVDGETRFLTAGPAEARCPGERIIFVPGVVNPYRPTVPGDGAFMCPADAVAEGFVGP
ncbi:hypothetical protein P7D22_12605 [Lichenihabitans sp. Uapishka_5]|uniref:hypothetical protein n=1 Tax=Lichenihabitans sp. Uapishka_5 TaxID=3037302 RepID=UPI0029E7D3E6|nr:hypothetical protein [Lichenihabitans sp. Uapishka_5]MDX7952012.1 hypothetical protein [Lichenihabitans sp. Uapishka_5]